MIENNTKLNEEDIKFIVKKSLWNNVFIIIYRLLCILLGIFFIMYSVPSMDIPHPEYSTVITTLICGLLILFVGIFGIKIIFKKKTIKNAYLNLTRNIILDEEKITMKINNNNLNVTNEFKYNIFNKYYKTNNGLYIKLKNKNQFVIIHKDSYVKGTEEDVILLLERNNIIIK